VNELLRHTSGSDSQRTAARERPVAECTCYERTFPAAAAFVKEAREAVSGAVGQLGVDEHILDDVRLCVSEAVTNAARHAYGHGPGTVHVSVARRGEGAVVRVRDFGSGIIASGGDGSGGFGLSIIATLTDQYSLMSVSGIGTEVSMAFGTTLGANLR
jgi:anti-sigma regulatory factor (Ser/Thr protein kinase)